MRTVLDRALDAFVMFGERMFSKLSAEQQQAFITAANKFAKQLESLSSSQSAKLTGDATPADETRLGIDITLFLNQLVKSTGVYQAFEVIMRMISVPEPDSQVERPVGELPEKPVRNRFIEYVKELPSSGPPSKPTSTDDDDADGDAASN